MHLLVRSITEHSLLEGARIVAGSSGMNNQVLWVNLMEILDTPASLQRGELVITTGYKLDDQNRHPDLIRQLKERGISCIAIQPGYYIDSIPAYILEDADTYGLPVLELPKNLTFSEIMHTLMEHIALPRDALIHPDVAALRMHLRQLEEEKAAALRQLWERAPDGRLHVLLVAQSGAGSPSKPGSKVLNLLRASLRGKYAGILTHAEGNEALLVMALKEDAASHGALLEMAEQLPALSKHEHMHLLIGASSAAEGGSLIQAFEEAMEGCEMLRRIGALRGLCPFSSIGLFEMLENVQKTNGRALLLAHDALRELDQYDRTHATSLLHTLRAYLASGGNSAQASAKLFIHRHTMKNRMEKVISVSGMDVRDYYVRLHFSLALLLSDCFSPYE